MTPTEKAARGVERLERELSAKQSALAEAKVVQDAAERKYDASQADADLDVASKARLKTESLYRQMVSAQEALTQASGEHRQLHIAQLRAELDAARPKLESWQSRLPVAEFAAAERTLYSVVVQSDFIVDAARKEHARLAAIAAEAGVRFNIPCPTPEDALLHVQRELAGLREREDRDSVGQWIGDPPMHGRWQANGMTARELEQAAVLSRMNGGVK